MNGQDREPTDSNGSDTAPPQAPLIRWPIYRGWWIVLAAAGVLAVVDFADSQASSRLFVSALSDKLFGIIPLYLLASITAFSVLLVARPLVGYLADRVGWRLVVTMLLLAGGMAFILLSSVTSSIPSYTAAVLVASFLGAGLYIALAVSVTNFFNRNRGKAFAVILIGPIVPVLFQAPLVDILFNLSIFGPELSDQTRSWPIWRPSILLPGIVLCLAAIPLVYLLSRQGKENVLSGSSVTGEIETESPPTSVGPYNWRLAMILVSKPYWLYAVALSLQSIGITAMLFAAANTPFVFTIPILWYVDTITVIAWFGVAGLLVSGILSDRLDRRRVVVGVLILQLACALLMVIATDVAEVFLFALASSTGSGAMSAANASLLAQYWGGRHFGLLMGLQISVIALLNASWWLISPQIGVSMSTKPQPLQLVVHAILPLAIALVLILLMKWPQSPAPDPVEAEPQMA